MNVYLDNSATTAVDGEVVKEMMPYFSDVYGNASSFQSFGRGSKLIVEDCRKKAAGFLNALSEEIIFTGCGTESDNLALFGVVDGFGKKAHIITTKIEHHAVLYSAQKLEKMGHRVTYLGVDKRGKISLDELREAICDETVLVSIMHANNEIGTFEPIKDAGKIIKEINKNRKHKIYFHTDAVQTAGKIAIDVQDLGVDLLSVSAHKFNGPKGVGLLFIKTGTIINPIMFGGHHENNLRPGTENIAYIVGLTKALEISVGRMEQNYKHLLTLREKLKKGILDLIPQVSVNGSDDGAIANILNVSFNYIEGESLLARLDAKGIAASSGSACATGSPSHVLEALGIDPISAQGAIRFSFGHYNSQQEVDYVLSVLPEIVESLRKMSPLWRG
jgi:cysteine desulfurase